MNCCRRLLKVCEAASVVKLRVPQRSSQEAGVVVAASLHLSDRAFMGRTNWGLLALLGTSRELPCKAELLSFLWPPRPHCFKAERWQGAGGGGGGASAGLLVVVLAERLLLTVRSSDADKYLKSGTNFSSQSQNHCTIMPRPLRYSLRA